jgi:hypothetical protein
MRSLLGFQQMTKGLVLPHVNLNAAQVFGRRTSALARKNARVVFFADI